MVQIGLYHLDILLISVQNHGMDRQISPLLRQTDVADLLGVTIAALRRWRLDRRGPPYIQVEGVVRYREDDITSWLTARTVSPPSAPQAEVVGAGQ